jgi:peptidoglycan/xylan/chitin deacetylase (PgdA/CDA1 family)
MGKKRRPKAKTTPPQAARPMEVAPSADVASGGGAARHGAGSRKKKKQKARAERKAAARQAPLVNTSTTSVALDLLVLKAAPAQLAPPPSLWATGDAESSPATPPMGTPAHFEADAHVSGDLAAPALFDQALQLRGPLAGPAHFELPATVEEVPAPPPAPPSAPVVVSAPPRALPRPTVVVAPPTRWSWMAAASALLVAGSLGLAGYGVWVKTRPVPVVVATIPPPPPEPEYATLYKPRALPAGVDVFSPLAPRPPQAVIRGDRRGTKVALTFDACSTTRFIGWDQRVMDILERYEVPATFFLGGRLLEQRPEIAQLLAQNPLFDLQNHTFVHPHLPEMTPTRVVEELERTDFALFNAVGRRAVMFRPPFGEYSTDVVKAATRAGYLPVQFDVASGDPDPGFHWNQLLESVSTQVGPGSIVVMHANGNGFHTVDALPLIIDVLRGRGLELTTVGDVLADGNWLTDDGHKGPQRKKPPEKEKDKEKARHHAARVADGTTPAAMAAGQELQ